MKKAAVGAEPNESPGEMLSQRHKQVFVALT